jgi:hypothetical protein
MSELEEGPQPRLDRPRNGCGMIALYICEQFGLELELPASRRPSTVEDSIFYLP